MKRKLDNQGKSRMKSCCRRRRGLRPGRSRRGRHRTRNLIFHQFRFLFSSLEPDNSGESANIRDGCATAEKSKYRTPNANINAMYCNRRSRDKNKLRQWIKKITCEPDPRLSKLVSYSTTSATVIVDFKCPLTN